MRFSNLLATASLFSAAAVLASPIAHVHHQHDKRGVVVVTRTTLVTVYGNNQAPPTTTTSVNVDSLTSAAAANTYTTVVSVAPLSQSSVSVSKTTSVGAIPSASASSGSGSDDDDVSSAAGALGITYSPYSASGACKSLSDIESDLSAIPEFGIIRLYGVDCDQVALVLQAKKSSQKIFAGIYYVDAIEDGISTLAAAVESYGSWDDIYTVSIGNELVNSGSATVDVVAGYLETGRSALTAAGYSGPVVSVDTFIAIINNPGLCSLSDYVAANAHAYFDGGVTYDQAGEWVLEQIQRVWTACGGDKDVLITESGWPSVGSTIGVAVPSESNQADAIASIKAAVGSDVILYNAYNDYWKADGEYGCEKYWGIYSS